MIGIKIRLMINDHLIELCNEYDIHSYIYYLCIKLTSFKLRISYFI